MYISSCPKNHPSSSILFFLQSLKVHEFHRIYVESGVNERIGPLLLGTLVAVRAVTYFEGEHARPTSKKINFHHHIRFPITIVRGRLLGWQTLYVLTNIIICSHEYY